MRTLFMMRCWATPSGGWMNQRLMHTIVLLPFMLRIRKLYVREHEEFQVN